jgi:hypothetical protein
MRRFAICLFLVVLASSARAQFDTATVLGTVTDPSGAVVPHCNVVLRNTATGVEQTAATDEQGQYRFVGVPIGHYRLEVTARGFAAAAATFELEVGARQRVDVQLKVAAANTSVTATAEAAQLETDSSEHGQVVATQEIAALPLNGREYSQLVELTTGVVPSPSELGTGYGQREGAFNVNGLRSVYSNYLLDGLDNNFYGTSNQGFSNEVVQLSPDAVQEFQVVTNNMSAEYGRAGGATINVVTKYGTNELHGGVWEFIRNTDLDAAGFFKPDIGGKPALHQNQFGGDLGGPLKKDKLFYFLDYEGFRQTSSFTDSATLPTCAERGFTGDSENQCNNGAAQGYYLIDDKVDTNTQATGTLPVDNPCNYNMGKNPCNNAAYFGGGLGETIPIPGFPTQAQLGGTQYLNGHVPASAVIPYAAQILQTMLPYPTNDNSTSNYIILHPNTFDRDKGDVKVDYDASKTLRLFARYSQARFNAYDPGTIQGTAGLGGDGHIYAPVVQIVGGATWTISPVSVLEARFGFSRMQAGKTPPLAGGPSMADQFGQNWDGLPGDNESQYTGGITYEDFSDGGFTSLGRLWTSPQYQNPTVWNPKANYTRLLRSHTIKAGVEYQMLHVAQQDLHPVMGGDVYAAQISGYCYYHDCYAAYGAPLYGAQTGETAKMFDYADFLLGYRWAAGLSNAPVANIRDWGWSGYLQDDWKVNRRLTMNLGLRYEYYTPIYEANNHLSNFNPNDPGTMILASSGNRYTVNPNKEDFGPRVGAAFTLDSKTVLRGGYGISYSHWNRVGSSYLTLNAPFGVTSLEYVYPSLPTYSNTQSGFTTAFVGSLLDPSNANYNPQNTALQYMPQNSPDTQVRSWFFSVQRDLGHNWLLDLAYVGNSGINEVFFNDINQAAPQATADGTASLDSRIYQYPGFGSIIGTLPWGTSDYNGLQAKAEKRFSEGLYLLESFTWSKAIDIAAQSLDGGGNCSNCANGIPSVQNIYDWQADRGLSAYNHPFVNATSLVWSLPVGKGQWLLPNANSVLNQIVGGWQTTGIFQARSGDPLTMAYSPDSNSNNQVSGLITINGRNAYRPNLTGAAIKNTDWAYSSALGGIPFLNNSPTTPAYTTPPANAPFGNSPRDAVRGFGFWELDLGLTKDFPLTERARLQLRAEAFNLTNETNFGDPNTLLGGTFGVVNSALPARELQFAGKIVF